MSQPQRTLETEDEMPKEKMVIAETKDIEDVMGDTIVKVADLYDRMEDLEAKVLLLPEIKLLLHNVASAQSLMAASAQSMAETFKKSEERAELQDKRYEALVKTTVDSAATDNKVPLKTHFWTVAAALIPSVVIGVSALLYVLYDTKQEIKATMTSIAVGQAKTQELLKDTKESIKEEVHDAVKEVK